MNKEELINKLTYLYKIHKTKLIQYQQENKLSENCGCITRESCEIVSLLPKMQLLGVTFEDFIYR